MDRIVKMIEGHVIVPHEIRIACPYLAQQEVYMKAIGALSASIPGLDAKTVLLSIIDSMQGQQNQYVILDTVVTNSPGFLEDANRLNVAISRAQIGMVVFGRRNAISSTKDSNIPRYHKIIQKQGGVGTLQGSIDDRTSRLVEEPSAFKLSDDVYPFYREIADLEGLRHTVTLGDDPVFDIANLFREAIKKRP